MDTDLDISLYKERGFIVVKNAFPKDDLLNFKNMMQHFFRSKLDISSPPANASFKELYDSLIKKNPEMASEIQRTICKTPEFYRLVSSKKLSHSLKMILELNQIDPLYFISNGIIFGTNNKEQTSRALNMQLTWHNDIYYTIPKSKFVQIWAPILEDSTKSNGTLVVLPGSHKKNILKQKFHPDKPYLHWYSVSDDQISEFSPTSISVELGDIIIFDGRLIHASGEIKTDTVRCTMIGVVHNAKDPNFNPMIVSYLYNKMTPEEYYFENNNNPNIIDKLKEQYHKQPEPVGGV